MSTRVQYRRNTHTTNERKKKNFEKEKVQKETLMIVVVLTA
jgi:hypothetical protein